MEFILGFIILALIIARASNTDGKKQSRQKTKRSTAESDGFSKLVVFSFCVVIVFAIMPEAILMIGGPVLLLRIITFIT